MKIVNISIDILEVVDVYFPIVCKNVIVKWKSEKINRGLSTIQECLCGNYI